MQVLTEAIGLGGRRQLGPVLDPHAFGSNPGVPALTRMLVAVVVAIGRHLQVDGAGERNEHLHGVAKARGIDRIEEQRLRIPGVHYTSDAIVAAVEIDLATHAVGSSKQLVVERATNHHHRRMGVVVRRLPAAAIQERNLEHRKRISVDSVAVLAHRQHAGVRRNHRWCHRIQRGLSFGAVIAHQAHRIGVAHRFRRLALVLRGVLRPPVVDQRHEQLRRLVGNRIVGGSAEHRVGGHRCGHAATDRHHHQRRQQRILAETAQTKLEVIGKHRNPLRR